MYTQNDRVTVDSRMGGSLTIRLLCRNDNKTWYGIIDMPENPDWHNQNWICSESEIRKEAA